MTVDVQEHAAVAAADDAGVRALLSCWIRERVEQTHMPDESTIVITLPQQDARIVVGVERPSLTFRPKLVLPATIEMDGRSPEPIRLARLAALIADDLSVHSGSDVLLDRIVDSRTAVATFLERRATDIDRLWGPEPLEFGESEQALLLGHLSHPTPKSRVEMDEGARENYSPELAGRFPLRWLAVDPELVRHGSALADSAPAIAQRLLRADPGVDNTALDAAVRAVGGQRTLLPAHPYEVEWLANQGESAELFASGAVVDLGAWGTPYLPTTSVRTVYRRDAPWQLKFSLHVSITNSLRVTLPKELDRAVEAARLATTEIGTRAAAAAPRFVLIHDPAYLTVVGDGHVLNGFSVLLRANRWTRDGPHDVSALTTLCQDHPHGGRSRLAAIIAAIAAREHRPESNVAREWFGRFCDVVVSSLVRLYLDVGLCFEAHQQNTLVELEDGWPVRGVYRDSQGYFHREAAHGDLVAVVPGLGEATESIFPEELADERLVYYLFVNLTLGVVNALGDCIDEGVLLGDLRTLLETERARPGRYPARLLDRLLDDERLPCKANLLTRARGMDELVGDIAEQSVYVTVPNPLKAVGGDDGRSGCGRAYPASEERASRGRGRPSSPPTAWSQTVDGITLTAMPVSVGEHAELVQDWMNRPHVAPWWEAERVDAGAYLAELTHSQPWIFSVDGEPFGYVETYRVFDDPLAEHYPARPGDVGWHVLVGPERFIGSGIPRLMGRAVLRYLFGQGDRVVCEPDVRNARMHAYCRALGFTAMGELELPDKRALLMVRPRDGFEDRS